MNQHAASSDSQDVHQTISERLLDPSLNDIERGGLIRGLLSKGNTTDEVCRMVGKSPPWLYSKLYLSYLDSSVAALLDEKLPPPERLKKDVAAELGKYAPDVQRKVAHQLVGRRVTKVRVHELAGEHGEPVRGRKTGVRRSSKSSKPAQTPQEKPAQPNTSPSQPDDEDEPFNPNEPDEDDEGTVDKPLDPEALELDDDDDDGEVPSTVLSPDEFDPGDDDEDDLFDPDEDEDGEEELFDPDEEDDPPDSDHSGNGTRSAEQQSSASFNGQCDSSRSADIARAVLEGERSSQGPSAQRPNGLDPDDDGKILVQTKSIGEMSEAELGRALKHLTDEQLSRLYLRFWWIARMGIRVSEAAEAEFSLRNASPPDVYAYESRGSSNNTR